MPKFEPDIRPSDKILPPSAILEFLPSLRTILIYSGEILLLLEILPIAHCGLQDFALVTLALGGGRAESRLKRHSGAKFPRLASVKSLLIAKYGGFKLVIFAARQISWAVAGFEAAIERCGCLGLFLRVARGLHYSAIRGGLKIVIFAVRIATNFTP